MRLFLACLVIERQFCGRKRTRKKKKLKVTALGDSITKGVVLTDQADASLVNGFTLQQKNKTINWAARTLRNIDSGYTVAYATDVLSEPPSCSEA